MQKTNYQEFLKLKVLNIIAFRFNKRLLSVRILSASLTLETSRPPRHSPPRPQQPPPPPPPPLPLPASSPQPANHMPPKYRFLKLPLGGGTTMNSVSNVGSHLLFEIPFFSEKPHLFYTH